MEDSFRHVAPFYDVLMAEVPYDEWLEYYRLLLTLNNSRPKTLLDVCCGTGILAEMLCHVGFDVTGFDLSEPMIEVANARAPSLKMGFHVADARIFDLGRSFEGAYSFFDSLNYLTTTEALNDALRRVAGHLDPGAYFIFDLNTEYAFVHRMFDQKDLRGAHGLKYDWKGDYDRESRLIDVRMDFEWQGEKVTVHQMQRAHPLDEVRELLADAGFKAVRAYHSYSLDPVRKSSDRVHFVARGSGRPV